MTEERLRISQISTVDINGGAAKVAWTLFRAYRAAGFRSWLLVGEKRSADRDVFVIPNDASRSWWARLWLAAGRPLRRLQGKLPGAWALRRLLAAIGDPGRGLDQWRGLEDMSFPGAWRVLQITPETPQVVHCHNLHGPYFDLRALPWLSRQLPVVLTLHDTWLLSGHCDYFVDCQRWKDGCHNCPDLAIHPLKGVDPWAHNWRRKQAAYTRSRLYVATPCRWLMRNVEQSMLAPAVAEARVIPNGVDLHTFRPANQQAARSALGIPPDARVLLFAAYNPRGNVWKDYQTVRAAVAQAAGRLHGQRLLFLALGGDGPAERVGQTEIRFVPYQKDTETVARYYQAADLYLHAARADTFPNTILEALACGTPVVATAVDGIPEQVKGLRIAGAGPQALSSYGPDEATGALVPSGDAQGMAKAIISLLADEDLLTRLANNARGDAQRRFDLDRQVGDYLSWYRDILEGWQTSQ